eukprot:scaffold11783_cov120-Cylindrotheca_fusiformis.AAC.15
MVSRGKKYVLLQLALLGSAFDGAFATDESQSATLLRKRDETVTNAAVGDLWDVVTAEAELEAEVNEIYRELKGMSMPNSQPTLPPYFLPTLSPVSCSGFSREDYLLRILSQITPVDLLENRLTPQGKAFEYMSKFDPYLADPCDKNIAQRYGLITMFYSTKGESWTSSDGWLSDQNECSWEGVDCSNGVVTELDLEINNLDGSIPNELRTLTRLEDLDLFANSLTGSIPDGLRYLTNLESIDLQENELTGMAFPSSITKLSNLESYKVTGNLLSDPIPTEIGLLRSLEELWASDNGIDGTLPSEMGNLRALTTLALNENDIKGSIPSELGLITFEELYLHSNFLAETLPSQLFNVASLKEFRLDGNFFVGDLPTQVGLLTNLEDFRVDNNNLDGTLPRQLGSLTDLKYLKLGENFWRGSVPDVFDDYKALEYFDISGNEAITGNLPSSVFSIPTIRFIYMHECNNLGGTIPSTYQNPPELRDLYLYSTNIAGTVPPVTNARLRTLNEFLIQDTNIRGSMPDSVCNLRETGILDDLWADCGGPNPELQCAFPDCCNRCFEGTAESG